MKTLLILRHAKSSWKYPELSDHDRPLNNRGKRDAPLMGQLIAEEGLTPELILTSSAVRAWKTAELVAEQCGYEDEIHVVRALYHAGPETFYEVISQIPDRYSCILVIGHNPGIEELLEDLTGIWERMPTAALAQVNLEFDTWQLVGKIENAELVDLWLPKQLI